MEGVLVIKKVSVKLFSFFNGGSIGDQENVCQTLELLYWREYWWSRTCLSNSSASLMEGVLVIKNVSVKLFSFFNGGSIGDEGLVSVKLFSLEGVQSNSSSVEAVLVIKNVSVKLFSFINGGSIGDEERVCQTLVWSNSSASSTEGVLVMKNVSVKLFSFFSGGSIGDQERVCQTLQLHQWREYWWWRTCLSNSSVSSVEGVLVIKNVSVKLFSFINGGSIGDQERVCQTLQLLQWREYWWWRTCLSNSSVSSVEAVLVIKNVSVKLFSFINGGSIGDEERVCQTLQLLQWREYWWSRTCLSNSSASSMEGVLVSNSSSVEESRTCLSNSSASSMEGVLVMKNVSVKLFSFFSGGSIGDQERVCQTLQLHQWREYWWSRTCLSNSSASLLEGVLVIMNVSVKLFSFFNGGSIGNQEFVCQTLQLH